jgi:hypothetical protein
MYVRASNRQSALLVAQHTQNKSTMPLQINPLLSLSTNLPTLGLWQSGGTRLIKIFISIIENINVNASFQCCPLLVDSIVPLAEELSTFDSTVWYA